MNSIACLRLTNSVSPLNFFWGEFPFIEIIVQAICYWWWIFFSIFRGPIHRERRNYLRTALKEMSLILSDQPGLLGPKVCNFLKLTKLFSLYFSFFKFRPCEILKRNYYPLSFHNLYTHKLCTCRRWNFKGTLPQVSPCSLCLKNKGENTS